MTESASPHVPPVSKKKKTFSILFTLVVLAVVFLFLGAIATPKFLKFSCKSKQSEAKTNLAGLFTAEKAFFGEYGFYTTDLVALGWTPDGSPIYAYGFAVAAERTSDPKVPDLDPTRRTTLDARVAGTKYSLAKTTGLKSRAFTDAEFATAFASATATSTSFVAVAFGDIDADGGEEKLDIWTIDEKRELTVVDNDCSN